MKRIQRDRPLLGEMVMLGTSHVLIVPTSMSSVPRREHLNRIMSPYIRPIVSRKLIGCDIHTCGIENIYERATSIRTNDFMNEIHITRALLSNASWIMNISTSIV